MNLSVDICGITFKNPIIAASGTFGFGREYSDYIDLSLLGGISVKGLTIKPRSGNRPPRIAETPSGMLNSVGLQNPGVDYFLEYELPWLKKYDTRIIANINGNTIDEYCELAERLSKCSADMIEVNVSCPNVKQGGMAFGINPDSVFKVTKEVKAVAMQPIIVKLSPSAPDMAEAAKAAEQAGADAVSLINTLPGMAIDIKTRKPILANITGGLSGPAIKPIALRMVWQAANAVKIPVIGMGGIMTGEDAIEFLLAGATAISVGTANLLEPGACILILEQIKQYLASNNIEDVRELTRGLII
jgi:dihydroorotate dehydrogenase (NAD+) catalytic subunit